MEGIKHIIFDLGGVLLDIDYKKTEDAFVALGYKKFAEDYTQAAQVALFSAYETGKIDTQAFLEEVRKNIGLPLSDTEIVGAWNAMLLEFPLRRLQILQQLQLHHDIVLLSNTNELHEIAFNQKLKERCGFNSLGVFFDKVFLSHRIGMRKPHPETFEYVLKECNFKAEDTLFIDDSIQHIEGAKSVGINTIFLEKGMSIEHDIFKAKV